MGPTPRHMAALAGLLLGTAAVAQPPQPPGPPQPRITAALPTGAKAGTSVEVAVTGTDLDGPARLLFSHPGITAEAVSTPEQKPDPKAKAKPAPKRGGPASTTVRFKVDVPAKVPAGWYDVRVANKWGVSNPRAFVVGTRPEVNEAEPNNDVPEAQRVAPGTVVNGVISSPTDVDYTVFAGKAGERVTLVCQSGAVDGRAKPLVEVYAADGRRVASGRASYDGDVTVEATLPGDGDYHVRVCEFAYQTGGADHFYRLTVGAKPERSGKVPPAMAFHDDLASPVSVEKGEPNDTAATAEAIPVPCEVAGRFDRPGDRDVFKFTAKKGEPLMLELLAERIGGPNDVFLRVRDSAGKDLLGDLDDDQDSLHPTGFVSRSSDPPATRFTPPADGTYFAVVGAHDSTTVFGPQAVYRLRVRRPTPDFRAVVMARNKTQPDAPVLRAGGTAAVDVLVHRTDGFTGPVTATAADLPPGVTARPAVVGPGQRYGTLVLSAAANAKAFTGPIRVACEAQADAGTLIREGRPASVTWGLPQNVQNAPTAGRLDRQLVLAVRPDGAAFRLIAEADPKALAVKPGTKVTVPVRVEWQRFAPRKGPLTVQAEPTQPNQNQPIAVAATPVPAGKRTATVTLDVRANTQPGRYAVVLRGEATVPDPRNPSATVTATAFADPIEVTVLPKK